MSGLNDLCVMMLKQLWGALQLRFPTSHASSDSSILQDRYHEYVYRDHTQHPIVGRDAIIGDIFEALDRPANLVVVQGLTGVGLSSIASHMHKRLCAQIPEGKYVSAIHYVGGCPFSTESRIIMNRIAAFLLKRFNIERQIPLDYSELVRAFHSILTQAAAVAGSRQRIVIIIDALHMISSSHFGHMLQWLPEGLPPTVHVLLTVVSDSEQGQLLSRRLPKQQIIDVPPLNRAGASELISTMLHDMNRALSVAQMQCILNKADGLKPAFLSLTCQLVHDFGKFDRVFSLNERLDMFVENLPQDLRMLGTTLVERFDDEFPKEEYGDLVEKVFSYVATSRDGLSDTELLDLLGSMEGGTIQPASRLIWSRIFMSLEPFIMSTPPNQDRYILLKHYCLVLAVQRIYFADSSRSLDLWVKVYSFVQAKLRAQEKDSLDVASDALKNVTARNLEERYHSKLAKYFQLREQGDGRSSWTGVYPRALQQLPHHLVTARMWDKLVDTLTDLRFVEGKFRLGMGHDVISDLIEALASAAPKSKAASGDKSAKLSNNHRKVIAMYQFISQNFQALLSEPRLVFQYAANQADGSILHQLACKFWEDGSMVQAWMQWHNKSSAAEPCMSVMVKHTSPVTCVDFTSDGVGLYSVSEDGLLCSWDAYGGNIISFFEAHVLSTYGVASLPGNLRSHVRGRLTSLDSRVITCGRDKSGKVWDARGQVCERTLVGPEGRVLSCCFSKELGTIVLTSWDKNAYVYDLEEGTLLKKLVGHKNAVMNAQFDPNGEVLATVSDDETCILWDTGSWNVLATVEGHDNSVTCVSFSGDGTFFATSSYDKTLRLWSVADCINSEFEVGAFFDDAAMEWRRRRLELCICVGHTDRVTSCSVSPNGKFVASGSKDACVMIWNAAMSEEMTTLRAKGLEVAIAPIFRLDGHSGGINSVKFAVDSIRVASGSDDGSIRLWDFSGGSTPVPSGHSDVVSGVTAVVRGECGCSVSINGQLKYWDCRRVF
jgi:WD40 repeat protein